MIRKILSFGILIALLFVLVTVTQGLARVTDRLVEQSGDDGRHLSPYSNGDSQ